MILWIAISSIVIGLVFFLVMIWACMVMAAREDEWWGWK